ncbi:MAG TPA: serine hydrolase domain-containing protein [Candidatus Limnocylindrales bacterium]|nr:serine hydrolase domain-containing protein [Candidatus Limnocylindrales bacterium]
MLKLNQSRFAKRICAVIVAAMLASALRSAPQERSPQHANWVTFTQQFDAAVDRDKIVGSSVLVIKDGHVIEHHEHGFADRAPNKPVTERTLYHYGSITKTLTAISIMQLRDRGRLTLDDHVTQYIPELRMVHNPFGSMDNITIRMLLSHSAGFQNPTWPYKEGKPWEPFEPTTWAQLVAMMPYQEILFQPGSRYSYSNPAFIYLARIIEQLTGDPWETYVQKNIFAPLGLTHSYFGVTPYYLAADRSHNYTVHASKGDHDSAGKNDSAGQNVPQDNGADFDPGITIPNGGWNAPLSDLAIYLAFLTNATHGDPATQQIYDTVLKRSSFEEMWKPLLPTSPGAQTTGDESESIGLSFFILRRGQTTFIGHTGSQAGFLAFMYFNPANGNAVVAAFNTASDDESRKEKSAFEIVREAALKLIESPKLIE